MFHLPLRLARRYVFSRKSRNLIHVISGISMFVIGAVAAAMVAVLSAFNGIGDVVEELFGTLDAEWAVVPTEGAVLSDTLGPWIEAVLPGAIVAPVVEEQAVLRGIDGEPVVVSVLGIDGRFAEATDLERGLMGGAWQEVWAGAPCATLGAGVRNRLGVAVDGSQAAVLTLGAPIRGKSLARSGERAFRSRQVVACDVLSVNADIDARSVLLPLDAARDLFDRAGHVSRYEVRPPDGVDPEAAAALLQLGPEARLRTRAEKNRLIHATNRAEKWATFLILSFILVVAAFNVMASLTMLILDKREDIAVLQAIGLTGSALERAFSLQGLIIHAVGGGAGLLAGILLVLGQTHFGWLALEGSVVPHYPVRLALGDVAGVFAVVMCVGGLGSALMVRVLVRRLTQPARGAQAHPA